MLLKKILGFYKNSRRKTEAMAEAIDKELIGLNSKYENLIGFGFESAANMDNNVNGMRRKLSEKAIKEVFLYAERTFYFWQQLPEEIKFRKSNVIFYVVKCTA